MRIPQELQSLNNWIVWKEVKKEGKEKPVKIPYSIKTKKGFRQKKEELATYKEVVDFYNLNKAFYSGIGFYLTEEDNITCIDLDNCIKEDRTLTPLAIELKKLFKDTYIEQSQSRKGLHIFCYGSIEKTIKKEDIEIYSSKRFIAITGIASIDNPIELTNHQEDINTLANKYGSLERLKKGNTKPIKIKDKIEQAPLTEDSLKVIAAILNSYDSNRFKDLYYTGNRSGYPSKSESDQALIKLICKYTEDTPTITNLWVNSALATELGRDKAFRKDYIEICITNAKSLNNSLKTSKERYISKDKEEQLRNKDRKAYKYKR